MRLARARVGVRATARVRVSFRVSVLIWGQKVRVWDGVRVSASELKRGACAPELLELARRDGEGHRVEGEPLRRTWHIHMYVRVHMHVHVDTCACKL